MTKFRFQDLEIWKESIETGNILFDIADKLEEKKLFRFAGSFEVPECVIICEKGGS